MNPEQNESQREFEKAYEKFRHEHINASFMPKEMALAMWQASEKRLLASKIVGPSDEEIIKLAGMADDPISIRAAITWYRDNLKLLPLTIDKSDISHKHEKNDISKVCIDKRDILRHIEKLLPSDEQIEIASIKDSASLRYDNKEKYCTNKDFVEARSSAFTRGANYIRDFISKRLAGM